MREVLRAVMTAGRSKSILRMDGGVWGMMIKEILRPRWDLSPRKDRGVNNDKIGRTDLPDPGPSGRGRGNLREFF